MKQQLSDAIADYRNFRMSEVKAKNTLRQDRSILLRFLTHTGNIYCENITERHVTEFLAKMAETHSPASLRLDMTVLRTFLKWCARTGRMPKHSDPMAGRKGPKVPHKERKRIHVSKFPALLEAAGKRHPRDRIFIALGLYTLSRVSEITSMRVGDVDLDAGYITSNVWKSKRMDRLKISRDLDTELRMWFTFYAEQVGPLTGDMFLIPARELRMEVGVPTTDRSFRLIPDRMVGNTATRMVKPALSDIGFDLGVYADLKGEGAHTLRRSGARAMFDKLSAEGHPRALRVVQSQLHHSNQSQTESYIGAEIDRLDRDEALTDFSLYDTTNVLDLSHYREQRG